jgi:putative flavoprotein involved in K+ transport
VEHFQVVVIGGGQAGLATGFHLSRAGLSYIILDDGQRIGDPWRRRWESLRLFTPARINGLPGAPFPESPGTYPTKDQVADYMESYAKRFGFPIRLGIKVTALTREGKQFVAIADESRISADQVVIATGSYSTPRKPSFAGDLDRGISEFHSSEYRMPSQFGNGDVLVVGAGNSGAEIALDAAAGHRTWLSGRVTGQVPQPIMFSRPIWWIGSRVLTRNTPVGRRMAGLVAGGRGQPLVRVRPNHLASAGVERVPRVVGVKEGKPQLEDGRVLDVGTVVWCTGFDNSYRWIKLPIADVKGHVMHKRGVVESQPGLYFVGLPFQYRLSSTLIAGVADDAKYVVENIRSQARDGGRPGEGV